MLIRALSDLHGNLPEIDPCDVFVIAGDVCPDFLSYPPGMGGPMLNGEEKQAEWLDTDFREWLDRVPAKHIVGVAGNHDFVFEHPELIPEGLRWHYLEDSEFVVPENGVRIWGTPWVPNLPSWAFHGSARMLEARFEAMPDEIDILVSHGPPFGAGDKVRNSYVGDRALAKHLSRSEHRPDMVFCGHIHEGRGKHWCHGVPIYNCSLVDEFYDVVHEPVTITYK